MPLKQRSSKTDRRYPYSSLAVVPTQATINFTCRNCNLGQEGKIYRDVREEATVKGNPPRVINELFGQYEFVFCFACQASYRINDWRRVAGLHIFDRVMSTPNPPNLIGGSNLTSGQPSLSSPNIGNDPRETILGHQIIIQRRGIATGGIFNSLVYFPGVYLTEISP